VYLGWYIKREDPPNQTGVLFIRTTKDEVEEVLWELDKEYYAMGSQPFRPYDSAEWTTNPKPEPAEMVVNDGSNPTRGGDNPAQVNPFE